MIFVTKYLRQIIAFVLVVLMLVLATLFHTGNTVTGELLANEAQLVYVESGKFIFYALGIISSAVAKFISKPKKTDAIQIVMYVCITFLSIVAYLAFLSKGSQLYMFDNTLAQWCQALLPIGSLVLSVVFMF